VHVTGCSVVFGLVSAVGSGLLAADHLTDSSVAAVQAVAVYCGGHPQCAARHGDILAVALTSPVGCVDADATGAGDVAS
jgi:hypothetical protein